MTAHFSTGVYGNSDQGSTSFVGTTFAQSISGEEPIFEAYVASNPTRNFRFCDEFDFQAGLQAMQGDPKAAPPQVIITLERGSRLDRELAECFDLDQSNIEDFMEAIALWSEDDKLKVLIHVMEFWNGFELGNDVPSDLAIYIEPYENLKELGEELVNKGCVAGLSSETPHDYIDWENLCCDLQLDYSVTEIAGRCVVFRAD